MKKYLLASIVLVSVHAFASSGAAADVIYRCAYDIYPSLLSHDRAQEFAGAIIPAEALKNENKTTYLTLAPNEVSGIDLEARIWFYNDGVATPVGEISLHKPGHSEQAVAGTSINFGVSGWLSYVDADGKIYDVICHPQ